MWGLFSRDPIKDFNYDIGEKVSGLEDKSLWTLYHGKKKGSGELVSIFAFEVKGANESQVHTAKGATKRLKTLRHPNVVTFLDSVETDKMIYIATEPITPLETYLQNNSESHNEVAVSWGLHQILKGLAFLVNDCNLIHNNVCMASIFVDAAGEWKLGGVDYMYPAQGPDSMPPAKMLLSLQKYDPPEKTEGKKMHSNKWASDMWGLGCLIWEVFNGMLPRTSSLKSLGRIPKNLVPSYCELVSASPKSRPNPANLLEECRKKGGFMDNSFVETMLFLEEIQIKDQSEKNKFLAGLTPSLDSFPPQMCRNKILPQLLNAFEYGNAGSSVLPSMLKIGKHLEKEEYQRKIVPCVVKLFSSPDRSTRVSLLQQIEFFIEHLSSTVVNDQIFPHVVSGFLDTNPMVRESTVKAMLHLACRLNYKNLNEELMKHFARLQAKDDQGGIRTNTTVCLGKIACHLHPSIRQKILISAFLRALKDPFPPARQAGILAMAATQNYYHMTEVANRLIPALCIMTQDPEKTIRDQAFRAIRGFLDKLEKLSENPELQEEMEREVMAGGSSAMSASGWAGWAVSGMSSLTSKIYSVTTKPRTAAVHSSDLESRAPVTEQKKPNSSDTKALSSISDAAKDLLGTPQEDEPAEELGGWDEEGWGDIEEEQTNKTSKALKTGAADVEGWDDDDNWGSIDDNIIDNRKLSSVPSASKKSVTGSSGDSWGEEEFAPADSGLATASQYNWGGGDKEDDFFSLIPNKASAQSTSIRTTPSRESPARATSASLKSSSKPEQIKEKPFSNTSAGGWEDNGSGWDAEDWGAASTEDCEADKKRREREEKRLQRQKEMQEKREARKGGAMKLGAKRL